MNKLGILLPVLMLLTLSLKAQEKLQITVDQAIDLGLKNSKTLHSSALRVQSAQSRLSETSASRLPSLRFTGAYRRLSYIEPVKFGAFTLSPSILNNYTSQLTLSQPLFTGFRLRSLEEAASYNAESVKEAYNRDRSELMYSISSAYWSYFKAQGLKNVKDESVERVRARLADAKNLMNSGMITRNDVLKLEVQLSDALYQQADAENAVRLAAVALNNTLGISLDTQIEITSTVSHAQSSSYAGLDELVREAMEKRSEIKAAEYQIKAGQAGVKTAKSGWYPQVSVVGNYYYNNPNSRVFPASKKFQDTWDAGINVSFNVFDWFTTKHQTEQAQAQLEQSIDAKSIARDNITLEVTQNYLSVEQAQKRIEIARLSVDQAEENMRMTTDQFKSGLALSADLIDAQTALSAAKLNHLTSVVDFELAKARLDKSIGKY